MKKNRSINALELNINGYEFDQLHDVVSNIGLLRQNYDMLRVENRRNERTIRALKKTCYEQTERNTWHLQYISFLENILNNLNVLVSVKDCQNRNLLWYNSNFNQMLGYRHRELQDFSAESASSLYHPDDCKKLLSRSKILNANKQLNQYSCIVRLRHINGQWVMFNSQWVVLKRSENGQLSHVLEIMTDISSFEYGN